jgi:hypothetical protein
MYGHTPAHVADGGDGRSKLGKLNDTPTHRMPIDVTVADLHNPRFPPSLSQRHPGPAVGSVASPPVHTQPQRASPLQRRAVSSVSVCDADHLVYQCL